MADPVQGPQGGQGGQQAPLQVNVPDELQKGTYSNAVSVNVNTNEVVSRVNMNHKTAESFLNVLSGAMQDFQQKQAAQQQQQAAAPMPATMPAQGVQAPAPAPMPMPQAPMPPMGGMPPQGPQPPMPPLPQNA
jgi:hypothetical protein